MTDFVHTFEGGTDGATLTTANTGAAGDTAFNTVIGGSAWTFSTVGKIRGTLGGRVQTGSGGTVWRAYDQWTANASVAGRFGFTFNSAVPNSFGLCVIVNSAFVNAMQLSTSSTGALLVQSAAGTTLATGPTLASGTAYYVEVQCQPGTGTTDGTIKVQLYTAATPGTLLLNYSSTTTNAGTAAIVRGSLGHGGTDPNLDMTFDDVLWRPGTVTAVGPPSTSNVLPNAVIDAAITAEPWATVTHSGAGSNDPDGAIASYAWTRTGGPTVSLTGAATSSVSYTAPAVYGGTSVTLQLTVTDTSAATSSATVTDTIKAPNEVAPVGGVLVPVRIQAATT